MAVGGVVRHPSNYENTQPGGGGEGGATVHNDLTGRTASGAHPSTAISGLGSAAVADTDEFVASDGSIVTAVKLTAAAYAALDPKVSTTLYVIVG